MRSNDGKILGLLSNNDVTFFIPPYQRNYEWDVQTCEVLYKDIVRVAAANKDHPSTATMHFFGTVIFYSTGSQYFGQPSKLILVDGQQRLTTIMLFMIAVRDVVTNPELGNLIEAKYLKNNNASEEDVECKIKLKQVESDWNTYKKLILKEPLDANELDTAVAQNYNYFKSQLEKLDQETISSLIQNGLENFSIVTIQLEPDINKWEKPQEIFESMNSLGKPLSLADLVRNYLLLGKSASTQMRLYHDYWLKIETNLSGNNNDFSVSAFIRDFMQLDDMSSFKKATVTNIGFEAQIWNAACVLWGHIPAADYRKVIIGLIFLRYISSAFEKRYKELVAQGDGFEDEKDAYLEVNVFWVPKEARWETIAAAAHTPEIGIVLDNAMRALEAENKTLKNVLPKIYASQDLDKRVLGEVVDLFTNEINMDDVEESKDLLGRTYEYCIAQFAAYEGTKGGEFYTPASIVKTLVSILKPYAGCRVYDPCCGSGGMFVQSVKFLAEHSQNRNNISVFGQESNSDTWKMAKINMAIRGINANLGDYHADTFMNDLHKNLRADIIMANPYVTGSSPVARATIYKTAFRGSFLFRILRFS